MLDRLKAVWQADIVQAAFATGIRLFSGVASYVLFAVVARFLGPTAFGDFSVLFSLAMLAGTLASFGQQVFLVKEIPRARESQSASLEFGTYLFSAVVTIVSASLISLILAYLLSSDHWRYSTSAVIFTTVLTAVYGVSQTTVGALRVQNATLFGIATRDLLWRLTSIGAVALFGTVIVDTVYHLDAGTAMAILSIVLLPIVALHITKITKHLRDRFPGVRVRFQWRAWLGVSSGLAIVGVIANGDAYAFTIVLGSVLSERETGAYFAALKSVEAINLFLMAVTLIVAPELSKAAARGDSKYLQRKCNSAFLMQAAPAILACAFIFVLAKPLLGIFATDYVQYANLLRILALAMLVNALTGSTVLLLQLGNLHWLQVWLQGGSLILALLLVPVLGPIIGVMAAGVGFFVSKSAWNIAAIIAIRRRFDADPSIVGFLQNGTRGIKEAWQDLMDQLKAITN